MNILPNGVAVIEGDTHHAVWCREQGLIHDRWFADRLCEHISPGDVVLDGGANIGTLTRALLNAGATVYAAECNPAALECLKHNCPTAHIIPAALGETAGTAHLTALANAGASHLSADGEIGVPVITIDSLNLSLRLIKLDIEGCELAALRGAQETIRQHRPVIVCEVNRGALAHQRESVDTLLDFLRSINYRFTVIQPDCDIHSAQFDILCKSE